MSDLVSGFSALQSALPAYQKAEEFYNGTNPEVFASRKMRAALARNGITFRTNFAKTPVDAVANRLSINAFTSGDPDATAVVQAIWDDNSMDLEAPELHHTACEYGDAYLYIWPDETQTSGVAMYLNDPSTVRVFYSAENPRIKAYAIKSWKLGDQYRCDVLYPDRIERYISKHDTKGLIDSDWEEYDPDGLGSLLDNPFGEVPVFHFRNARPYGVPMHSGAYGPQEAINKTVINWMSVMDSYSAPFRYALLSSDLDERSDSTDFGLFDEDETINSSNLAANRQPNSQISAEPGTFNEFDGTKSIGQLEGAPVNNFQSTVDSFIRYMAQATDTPLHLFDMVGDSPSGESLRVSEAPLVKMIQATQISFGSTWRDAFEFTLRIIGYGEGVKVNVAWANPTSTDDLENWQVIAAKLATGMPPRQVFLEAGYTSEQLDAWQVGPSVYTPPAVPALPEIKDPSI